MMACIRNNNDHQEFDSYQREHTLLSMLYIKGTRGNIRKEFNSNQKKYTCLSMLRIGRTSIPNPRRRRRWHNAHHQKGIRFESCGT
mmetsp:Transcript_42343/g.48132  ORF Transcript_42343/g.48132 Transcript_42343/m.48132 type:complete len:86 (-) Transcript_42343:21-278(-)